MTSECPHDFRHDVLDPVRPLNLGERLAIYRKLHPDRTLEVTLTPSDADETIRAFKVMTSDRNAIEEAYATLADVRARAARHQRTQRVIERLQFVAVGIALAACVHVALTVALKPVIAFITGVAE
jgi:hypothetical protein